MRLITARRKTVVLRKQAANIWRAYRHSGGIRSHHSRMHHIGQVVKVMPKTTYTFTATSATPCVFTTSVAANYKAGTAVRLYFTVPTGSVLPPPFVTGQTYYVVNPTSTTFQLSAAVNGTGIASSGTGAGQVRAYQPEENRFVAYDNHGARIVRRAQPTLKLARMAYEKRQMPNEHRKGNRN